MEGGDVSSNLADGDGGGIYLSNKNGANVTLQDAKGTEIAQKTISGNFAKCNGGAIYADNTVNISGISTLSNNIANKGGALYLNADANIINASITANMVYAKK